MNYLKVLVEPEQPKNVTKCQRGLKGLEARSFAELERVDGRIVGVKILACPIIPNHMLTRK